MFQEMVHRGSTRLQAAKCFQGAAKVCWMNDNRSFPCSCSNSLHSCLPASSSISFCLWDDNSWPKLLTVQAAAT